MIRGVMLDIAGVLVQGADIIVGADEALRRLRAAGLPVRFLTNTTRRPKRQVLEQLAASGIAADPDEVLTPAAAARDWLVANGYAPHLLVYPGLEEDFAGCPQGGRVAVVVGDAGPYFTYDRLNAAFRAIEAGAPFLALAENRVFKDADGKLSLDAGAFVRALEFSSGTQAQLFGKPAAAFFQAAAQSMGCKPGDCVMIGDDAESDVAGALAAGVGRGILVQTGKYRAGDESRFDPRPSAVVRDVAEAVDLILKDRAK
ncbi:hydrolase [Ruegeria marisrubri]|uniref:Haloacid dehalogenase-like hydrolase domain-containing protein 2 n=1 Tax=Ruegeria marisrubri TaxID=1685379 RepID=A0A0X3TQU1_9RHOB|nr:TIGR01458 family HAD-type hydrolase [Ruegeria marisrubri]KUJ76816.1 hydrolase [Ruegeria marisrubri]